MHAFQSRVDRISIRHASDNDKLDKKASNDGKKVIILWTPFFGNAMYILPMDRYTCPVTNCVFTPNRTLLDSADAVMFHVRDTNIYDLPKYRSEQQRWILLHHEAPPATPPEVIRGLDGLINWTVTYRQDSDVVLTTHYHRINRTTEGKPSERYDYSANKTRLVAWFVSNCKTDSKREEFVRQLKKTMTVDVFGACGPYQCHPKMSVKCYETIAREYRFYLSLENGMCKDYLTEKVFNILSYNIIPIVLGGAKYDYFLPPKSYINALDFPNTAALSQYLLLLAKNSYEYNRYFQWRKEWEQDPYQHYACSLCKKLNQNERKKSWDNLYSWWFEEANCSSWPVNGAAEDDYDLSVT